MIRLRLRHAARAAGAAAWLAGAACGLFLPASSAKAAVPPSPVAVRWIVAPPAPPAVEVTGLAVADLDRLRQTPPTTGQWQALFAIHAEANGAKPESALPAMLGRYVVGSNALRFEPQFPLAAGMVYRAVFNPSQLEEANPAMNVPVSATYQLPALAPGAATVVSAIYPNADVLPENLLKFYLHFSAPMSRGHVYQYIHLLDHAGKEVEVPFLELGEELWDPGLTRLTLLLDPGRIKRGVLPLEEIGSSIQAGQDYTLLIDRDWQDATGQPLRENHRKSFRVTAAQREPPNPAQWQIEAPAAGTREPLTVKFPRPMDHALALRLIRVAGATGPILDGSSALSEQDQRWIFTPSTVWAAGAHRLIVATMIEDLAGNNIGKAFDVDVFEDVQRSLTSETVELPFVIQ